MSRKRGKASVTSNEVDTYPVSLCSLSVFHSLSLPHPLAALSSFLCSLMKNLLDTREQLKILLLFSISSSFTYQPTSRSNNQWQCSSNTSDSVILNCKRESSFLLLSFSLSPFFVFAVFLPNSCRRLENGRENKKQTLNHWSIHMCAVAVAWAFFLFGSAFVPRILN